MFVSQLNELLKCIYLFFGDKIIELLLFYGGLKYV